MTFPINSQSYGQSTGTSQIPAPIFQPRDPLPTDIGGPYKIEQFWVNTQTYAIWVLEAFFSIGGVVTAQWRAIAPIVLMNRNPVTGMADQDYLYPEGQTWVNPTNDTYWILVDVTGTTPSWLQMNSGPTAGPVLSLSDGQSPTPVLAYPTLSGNIQLADGPLIQTIATTNTITIGLTEGTNGQIPIARTGGATAYALPTSPNATISITGGANTLEFDVAAPLGVAYGGTGDTSFTPYAVVTGGTTSTGPLQQVSGVGTAGQVLTSQGAGMLPHWASGSEALTITGNDSVAVSPDMNNWNLVGANGIEVTGNNSTGTLTINPSPQPGTAAWTPVLQFGGASVGIVYSTQTAYWLQVGNVVFFNISYVLTSKGSSHGDAYIAFSGATPPPAPGPSNLNQSGLIQFTQITFSAGFSTAVFIVSYLGGSDIALTQNGSGESGTLLTDTNFANNSAMSLSGFYFTD